MLWAGAHDPGRIPGIQFQLFDNLPGLEEERQPVLAQWQGFLFSEGERALEQKKKMVTDILKSERPCNAL
jgi:hypothetical protein